METSDIDHLDETESAFYQDVSVPVEEVDFSNYNQQLVAEEVKIPSGSNYPEDNKSDGSIKLAIVDHSLKTELIKKHVYYTIRGQDKNGSFENSRRFKDFRKLRTQLVAN